MADSRHCLYYIQRRGDYLGKTVQIVPHLTGAIQDWIERVARQPADDTGDEPDVCIIEVRLRPQSLIAQGCLFTNILLVIARAHLARRYRG